MTATPIELDRYSDVSVDTVTRINGHPVDLESFVADVRRLVLAAQDMLPTLTIDDTRELSELRRSLVPFIARHF